MQKKVFLNTLQHSIIPLCDIDSHRSYSFKSVGRVKIKPANHKRQQPLLHKPHFTPFASLCKYHRRHEGACTYFNKQQTHNPNTHNNYL